jgi:hypothetical protein
MPKKGIVKTVVVTVIAKVKQKQDEPFGDFVRRMRDEYAERNQTNRIVISVVD